MDITNAQRARVLVHALPYIQDYSGKMVVVKYGGNAMISEHLKDSVIRDICLLQLIGVKVVLVHGGGPEITDVLGKMGKKSTFVAGYGVWAWIRRDFPTYLFLKSEFVFLDYGESKLLFYIDYLALMGLCIFIAHYGAKAIRKLRKKSEAQ